MPETKYPEAPPDSNIVSFKHAALPDFLADDIAEFAGAGVSNRREDSVVPFLYVAQKGSPQVDRKSPAYIEGLEAGWIFDSSTGQKWDAEGDGPGPLLIQFAFEPAEVEWGLRDTPSQGFKAKHASDTPLLRQVREVPKEGKGVTRMLPNGNQLTTTKYHYCILLDDLRPVAVALSSSGLQPSRLLNMLFQNKKVPAASGLVTPPSFATLIQMHTEYRSDGKYSWYVPRFKDLGMLNLKENRKYIENGAYALAKSMFKASLETAIKTERPADDFHGTTVEAEADDTADNSPI